MSSAELIVHKNIIIKNELVKTFRGPNLSFSSSEGVSFPLTGNTLETMATESLEYFKTYFTTINSKII